MNKTNVIFRITSLLTEDKNKRKAFAFLLFLVILSAGFDVTVPIISQKLIDTMIQFFKTGAGSPMNVLVFSSIGILLATVASRLVRSTYNYNLFKVVTVAEDEAKHRAFEKYLKLHVLFHYNSNSGQIIGRIERGGNSIMTILYDIFGQNLLPAITIFLSIFIVLLFNDVLIAFLVFLPLPVYLFAVRHYTTRLYEIERQANDEFEIVSREAYDVAMNVHTVKKFSQERAEKEKQVRLVGRARETQYSAEKLWGIMENIQTLISTAGRISVILVAGFLVLNGSNTIGQFVLYFTLQNMVYSPLMQLSHTLPRLRRNSTRAERMFEIIDEPVKVFDKPEAMNLPPFHKQIELRNVSFRYSKNKNWAFRNVTVTIPANKTVALVGRSGSGKTTFINLLLRSFDPEEGAILVDGHDLRDVTQESLRKQTAVVPQEIDLFSRTIAENISYGEPKPNMERIIQAAKTAYAHDFIMKMEKGYDTVVGERGIKLSGGERQRIRIARAVHRDPKILILDEATSSLDTESEQLIQKATDALIKDRTTIIIAHRLSTILNADMILVFKAGTIEAIGTHSELLKISPTYQKLYSLQFNKA